VQAVGQFDEDHANIRGHGQDHLTHTFSLTPLITRKLHLTDFCNAVHDIGGFLAEQFCDFLHGGAGILNHIMQKTGDNAHHIHFHL